MKRMTMSSAVGSLAEYAVSLGDEILLLTKHGRAVAAVVPLRNAHWEAIALSQHPEFDQLLRALPDEHSSRRRKRSANRGQSHSGRSNGTKGALRPRRP